MPVKSFRPLTPSTRYITIASFDDITKTHPEKSLIEIKKKTGGRNAYGRVTSRGWGGGHKQFHRLVDFKRHKHGIEADVIAIEYDPLRTARLALLQYKDGEKRYVLLPASAKVGDTFITSEKAPMTPGNRMPLGNMLVGTFVYNVEFKHRGGAKLARSAGDYAEVLAKDGGYVDVLMPSTEVRKVPALAWASIGEVSNIRPRIVAVLNRTSGMLNLTVSFK